LGPTTSDTEIAVHLGFRADHAPSASRRLFAAVQWRHGSVTSLDGLGDPAPTCAPPRRGIGRLSRSNRNRQLGREWKKGRNKTLYFCFRAFSTPGAPATEAARGTGSALSWPAARARRRP